MKIKMPVQTGRRANPALIALACLLLLSLFVGARVMTNDITTALDRVLQSGVAPR